MSNEKKPFADILIIDDDPRVGQTLVNILGGMGHRVAHAMTLFDGVEKAREQEFDLVFLDVRLPDGSGLEHLVEIRESPSRPEVIVITGYASREGAETAIMGDAWDYLKKPVSLDSLKRVLASAMEYRGQKSVAREFASIDRDGIIGESPRLHYCLTTMAKAAMSQANTLVTGETGTGKELFARAIHKNSARANANFVVVDCGSLPKNLIESVLFGHKKGAYTGADRSEMGLIKHAHGGTLFLDEVGELPLGMQKTFLRVLEHRCFRPVGGLKEEESDFRLIAATNRDLNRMVSQGRFREDLLFRIQSIVIELPPLRKRNGDISILARSYMKALCAESGLPQKELAPCLMETLDAYDWPGNVRELQNSLEWAFTHALQEPVIFARYLPRHIRIKVAQDQVGDCMAPDFDNEDWSRLESWKDFRQDLMERGERQYMSRLMTQVSNNVRDAADISGLSQARIYQLLKKHNLPSKSVKN